MLLLGSLDVSQSKKKKSPWKDASQIKDLSEDPGGISRVSSSDQGGETLECGGGPCSVRTIDNL